jgi:transposase
MTYLNKESDLEIIVITIYCFVDEFLKGILGSIRHVLKKPDQHTPPMRKHNLSLAELITLALFRFFTGHHNWKQYYRFIQTYHAKDFPNLPNYQNFIADMNQLSGLAMLMLSAFMRFFRSITDTGRIKIVDSTKLEVCKIKREFTHKVCQNFAKKSKSSMGWFYGFKLHIIVNELMQILELRITPGNTDDRKGLDMMWNTIFGMIIADAGYLGKKWQEKAARLGKRLLTAVKANMKKIMTNTQHELLKLRQYVEIVFSVLKVRLGLETSLPRSPLGHFAHYLWCLTAYQMDQYFAFMFNNFQKLSVPMGLLA